MKFFLCLFALVTLLWIESEAVTHLRADGVTDTYTLIDATLLDRSGTAVETSDCKHTDFGPHITQTFDEHLNRSVFAFHSHIRQDDDRCINSDRQRIEIKTYDRSPRELLGYDGEYVTYSWNFKIDAGFLPPYSFCHIHQLKAVGGDDSMPIITVSLRKSTPNVLQLLQYDSKGSLIFLKEEPLSKFAGLWIRAESEVVYGYHGAYNMTLTNYATNEVLLRYSSNDIDFWRNDTATAMNFVRPKWGIYRSVQEAVLSRNETALFDDFCIGKGDVDEERCFERSDFISDSTPGAASIFTFNKFVILLTVLMFCFE